MYQFTRSFQQANLALGDTFALGDTASNAAAYFATRAGAAALFTKVLELKDAYQMPGVFAGFGSQMWDFADSASAQSMFEWWMKNSGTRDKLVRAVAFSDNAASSQKTTGFLGFDWFAAPARGFSAPTYQYFVNAIATTYPRLYSEAAAALGYNITQAQASSAQYNASTGQIRTDNDKAAQDRANCTTGNPMHDIPCQIEKLGATMKVVAYGAGALAAAFVTLRIVNAFRRA
jgi:hypothetical protein